MKVHIGVDRGSGPIHAVVAPVAELLHGDEDVAYADHGY